MKKVKPRYVKIDIGYGLAESWTTAKVVDSRRVKELFSDETRESLLVEVAGGERIWVDYWKEEDAVMEGKV